MAAVTDNIDELEKQIMEAVGEYEDVNKSLARLVSDIKRDLLNGKYKNRSGDLRRSIKVALVGNNISIKMLDYGYFISFGVKGKKYKKAYGLPIEVATTFGKKEGNRFGSSKVWGIRARNFYPQDIEERLFEILTNE